MVWRCGLSFWLDDSRLHTIFHSHPADAMPHHSPWQSRSPCSHCETTESQESCRGGAKKGRAGSVAGELLYAKPPNLPQDARDDERENQNGNHPPKSGDSAWDRFFAAKFAFDVFGVIKVFLRQSQAVGLGFGGPPSFFTRSAFWTGAGIARHGGAAVRAGLR